MSLSIRLQLARFLGLERAYLKKNYKLWLMCSIKIKLVRNRYDL